MPKTLEISVIAHVNVRDISQEGRNFWQLNSPSFPRKRESRVVGFIFWIPAFAGMTKILIEVINRPLACALFLRNVSIKIGRDADCRVG